MTDDKIRLKELIELFLKYGKWAIVEHVAQKILEYGENRVALKALSQSLERLSRVKEAIPVWEELLKIDRFDADVAKKLSFAILEEDSAKSIQYMKMSVEGFIKNSEFDELSDLWSKLIKAAHDDLTFFERVERMLVELKRSDLAAEMLRELYEYYEDLDVDIALEILKRILKYSPNDIASRKALVMMYTKKYGEHSQFEHFIKISRLNDFGVPVNSGIESFENNIVFDKGNYVFHRSWGLGVISDIDSEKIIIDFKTKENHQMSVQMALQSLMPVTADHLYVMQHNDPEVAKSLFVENILEFFTILLKSYHGEITVATIKKELIPAYLEQKNWSKWWSKTKTVLKKDPLFGFSDKKKDLLFLREKPVTFADELLNNFSKAASFSSKLNYAIEFVNNVEQKDGAEIAQFFVDFFQKASGEGSNTKLILSYFILRSLTKFIDEKSLKLSQIKTKVIDFIKTSKELPLISIKISSYDYKKDFVDLIEDIREDWIEVLTELLFETPVRIHRYIINLLIRARAYRQINDFIGKIINSGKQFPEIFLWVSKSIFTKAWDYQWLDYSKKELTLAHFRVINELKRVEIGKNRLKNIALDIVFENESLVLNEVVAEGEAEFLSKLYDILISAGYLEEAYLEKFINAVKSKFADFEPTKDISSGDDLNIGEEELIVTQAGLEKKREELNKMVHVEMVQLSKELSKAADLSGDMRENVDYNALLEKQSILKLSISRLDADLKRAKVIDIGAVSTETVRVGTVVEVSSIKGKETIKYAILGPWDADFDKNILSYRSPVAKALLKKRLDDDVDLRLGDEQQQYKIVSINSYTE
jgi:transcription elongation factor GreA